MRRSKTAARSATRARAALSGRSIPAAVFKARCLELMDRVHETGEEYIVTKHGEPVARLVPYAAPVRQTLFGAMKGTVLRYEWPFDSIDADGTSIAAEPCCCSTRTRGSGRSRVTRDA